MIKTENTSVRSWHHFSYVLWQYLCEGGMPSPSLIPHFIPYVAGRKAGIGVLRVVQQFLHLPGQHSEADIVGNSAGKLALWT